MTFLSRTALALLAALLGAGPALPQDARDKPPSEEDARLGKIIERWIQANETEREHVLREVMRNNDGKADDNFEHWFTHLGGTDEGWDRSRIRRRNAGEIFDRIAERLKLGSPILSHAEFVSYAKAYWGKVKSPLWREPQPFETVSEAERLFRNLDRDRDGYLSKTETGPALRAELKRWDRDRDGWITSDEYRPYFAQRLDRAYREAEQRSEKPLPVLEITLPEEDRPPVVRAGKLPLGLPAWFETVDTDLDGQIALYEWRRAGWPANEFTTLDPNDDGILEAGEILKLLAITERDGTRPHGYLLQKRVVSKEKSLK